jgi:hypothetical protein
MDEQTCLQHADGTLNVCQFLKMLDWLLFALIEGVDGDHFLVQDLWGGVNVQTRNHGGE